MSLEAKKFNINMNSNEFCLVPIFFLFCSWNTKGDWSVFRVSYPKRYHNKHRITLKARCNLIQTLFCIFKHTKIYDTLLAFFVFWNIYIGKRYPAQKGNRYLPKYAWVMKQKNKRKNRKMWLWLWMSLVLWLYFQCTYSVCVILL